MLDSDIGNNVLPLVRFYQREVKHEFNSEKEGRPIYYMADFVEIKIPGNAHTIIDTFVNESHKRLYPQQWAYYQNQKRDMNEADIQGTLLRDWPILTAAQAKELNHYHFYTVEQVAAASDEQLSKTTMIVGMSGLSFRDRAKQFLSRSKDSAVAEAQAEELRKRDAEIEQLKAQMAALMDNMPKRGRPAKEEVKD
jgi:hypothetical protein